MTIPPRENQSENVHMRLSLSHDESRLRGPGTRKFIDSRARTRLTSVCAFVCSRVRVCVCVRAENTHVDWAAASAVTAN